MRRGVPDGLLIGRVLLLLDCKRTVQRLQRDTAGNEYVLPDYEYHLPGRRVCVQLHVLPLVPAFTDMRGRMPACLRHVPALHLRDLLS